MFTGLIQAKTAVIGLDGSRLRVGAPCSWNDPIVLGESIAVDGCCLTVAGMESALEFDLSEETLARTTLGRLAAGSMVNLERALRVGDRLGGHFVQGHVDSVGSLVSRRSAKGSEVFRFAAPPGGAKYLIDKGSIAVNGISLTVIQPSGGIFDVAIVPSTLRETTLDGFEPGDAVNLEYDLLAKHIERLHSPQ